MSAPDDSRVVGEEVETTILGEGEFRYRVLARMGGAHPGVGPGQFISPHGLAVDSWGDIFVGEVSYTAWPALFPDMPAPEPLRTLRKLTRLPPQSAPRPTQEQPGR